MENETAELKRHVGLRMDQELYKRIEMFAKSSDRNMSNAICVLVKMGLEAQDDN